MLIAFLKGLNYRDESTFRDLDGHFLILQAVVQDSHLILINCCAQNDEGSQMCVLLEINRTVTSLDTPIIGGRGGGLILT